MQRSRLRNNLEEKSKRSIGLTLIGFVAIILIAIFLGPTLLVQFSVLLGKLNGSDEQVTVSRNAEFISPPLFNSHPDATSSGKIIISGTAPENAEIRIYIDGDIKEKIQTTKDGTFTVKNFELNEGENVITARTFIGKNKSNMSDNLVITYINKPPSLEIESPQNNESFSGDRNTVEVKGKTDKDVSVTVNGFWAIMKGDEEFSYRVLLQGGDNRIKVVATDKAGNKTEKEILVIYSQ